MDIFDEIGKLKREGRRGALATIVNLRGSIPSVMAAKMLVRDDGSSAATVGGGCVESDVRKGAMAVMRDGKPRTFNFNLDPQPDDDNGVVCGGSLQVFVEPVMPAPRLYMFGAGHVGSAVYKVATLGDLKSWLPTTAISMRTGRGSPMRTRSTPAKWMKSCPVSPRAIPVTL